jgi:hypothetical protein
VPLERDGSYQRAAYGVNDRQTAVAVADDDASVPRIDADVISIAAELDPVERRQIGSAKYSHRAVTGIRDEE